MLHYSMLWNLIRTFFASFQNILTPPTFVLMQLLTSVKRSQDEALGTY